MSTSPRTRLQRGERLNGCWIEAFSPITAEIMAASGYDTAMIDLEHGPGSFIDAIAMMQAVGNRGCAPLIRVGSADKVTIKRTLDIGPAGIMVPDVRSVIEAEAVVSACRYAPAGNRGAAPAIIRAADYGRDVEAYSNWMQSEFLLICQIESRHAVEDIEQIAAVDGIDMLFIGPADLSGSLGAFGRFDTDEFIAAFERIERVTLDAGKWLGTIPIPGWSAERLFANGHHL
ncbi:MAG: aldolase/citrate lyase family protein, partial [Gammaproteobacteria bacterium]|nr:aldolase/citrate lyase family protein [Gammaproteobacteria bacterium]